MRAKVACLAAFAVAMAFVEAAVVVYLREIIGGGPVFPMKEIPAALLAVEVGREAATIVMLLSVAFLSFRGEARRMGAFLVTFAVWDIFYYVWLKATIDWPSSLTEWDILFLIPVPWIGPVLAPLLISVLMVGTGSMITWLYYRNGEFRPGWLSWIFALTATAAILYSFMRDFSATLHQQMPQPYQYGWLIFGLVLYSAGFVVGYRDAGRS